jgi:hypothetical protein
MVCPDFVDEQGLMHHKVTSWQAHVVMADATVNQAQSLA